MTRASNSTSALRQILDDGVSLSVLFNAERGNSGQNVSERLGSGQSRVGQISAVGLRPIPLVEKLQTLKRMIASGKVALSTKVSLDAIKHELQKSENDGLSVHQMVAVLTEKKLLQPVKAPAAVFKLKALAPHLM